MNKGVNIFSLQGKTVLVTGAVGYLGEAMVRVLAEAGAHVLINSRSEKRCSLMVDNLRKDDLTVSGAVFDVADQKAVSDFFDQYGSKPLHGLVNNAYAGVVGNIEISSSNSYKESYDITMIAAHNILQMALPNLRKAVELTGDASVINISSMYAMVSPDQRVYETAKDVNPPFYGAAKAALLQWSRYAACEFGKEGIRVNSISPGPFPATEVQRDEPDFVEKLNHKVPMGRIGQASEMKGPILFLASSASSFVNGSNLVVDGGWTAW